MQSTKNVTRRALLGTALSAAGATALGPMFGVPETFAQQPRPDPVLQRTIEELAALVRELQNQTPLQRGTLQSLAVSTRLLAASSRANGLDRRLARSFQRAIDAEGRERLIDRALSADMATHMNKSLESFGVRPEHHAVTDRDAAGRALTLMLSGRTDHLSNSLEQGAALLERYRAGIVQVTPDGRANVVVVQGMCPSFQMMCTTLALAAALICALTPFDPAAAPVCLAATLEMIAFCAIAYACS